MAKKTPLAAGTSPFAHLLGGAAALAGRALGNRAEEENDEPGAEAEGEEPEAEEEGGEEPETGKRGKKAKKAEDGSEEPGAEEEGEEPEAEEEGEEPEGKKASTPYQRGFAAANKRAAAIFSSPAAAGRPDLAAQLAFGTTMSSAEAIGVLSLANTDKGNPRGRLDDRMAGRREARPGAGTSASGEAGFADKMAAALKKAGR